MKIIINFDQPLTNVGEEIARSRIVTSYAFHNNVLTIFAIDIDYTLTNLAIFITDKFGAFGAKCRYIDDRRILTINKNKYVSIIGNKSCKLMQYGVGRDKYDEKILTIHDF